MANGARGLNLLLYVPVALLTYSCGTKTDVGCNDGHCPPDSDSVAVKSEQTHKKSSDEQNKTGIDQLTSDQKQQPRPSFEDDLQNSDAHNSSPGTQLNGDPKNDKKQPSANQPGVKTDPAENGHYTCFGEAPDHPDYLVEMCQSFQNGALRPEHGNFRNTIDQICGAKRTFANLFRKGCQWDGQGGRKASESFLQVLDSSEHGNDSAFHYESIYALKFKGKAEDFVRQYFRVYSDPDRFVQDGFRLPKNTKIIPKSQEQEKVSYGVEFDNGYFESKYDGQLTMSRLANGQLTVLVDRDNGSGYNINARRTLTFLLQKSPDEYYLVAAEICVFPLSFKLRLLLGIAPNSLKESDLDKLEMLRFNATRH